MREFLAICLRRAGHEVTVAKTGNEAVDRLRDVAIDIVITDLRMPGEIDVGKHQRVAAAPAIAQSDRGEIRGAAFAAR